MSGLPNYDPPDPREYICDYCGADARYEGRHGWRPDRCTGECGKRWRDADAEYERMRDEEHENKGWD